MGQDIGNELDGQNDRVDDLADQVRNADNTLHAKTGRGTMVDRKSESCGMIVGILSLLVASVAVPVRPPESWQYGARGQLWRIQGWRRTQYPFHP